MNTFAPIILFTYNRYEHTKKTIEALQKNIFADKSELFIFSDAAKDDSGKEKVDEVRKLIKSAAGFKSIKIIERKKNIGLADSVISGVSEIFKTYNKVIVLEDDIVTSVNFLLFMNSALDTFEKKQNIFSVSGYTFPISIPDVYKEPIYVAPRASSWGWGTWKDRWQKADWKVSDFQEFINSRQSIKKFNLGGNDLTRMLKNQMQGKIDSWAVRWTYSHFKNNAYCVYPVISKVQNIGADSSGLHSITTGRFTVNLDTAETAPEIPADLQTDKQILQSFKSFFNMNLAERVYWRLKRKFKIRN